MDSNPESKIETSNIDLHLLLDALQLSEATFRGAFEYSAIGMALVSLQGECIKVNQELCNMLGYTEKELLTFSFKKITHPDDFDKDLELFNRCLNGEIENYRLEKRYYHKDGSIVWGNLNVSLIKDNVFNPLYFVGQIENITERKNTEEQIIKEKSLSDSIINSLPGIFYLLDDTGKNLRWNRNLEKFSGYTSEEIINMSAPDFFDTTDYTKISDAIKKCLAEGKVDIEIDILTKNKEKFPFYFNGTAIIYEGKKCIIGTGFNISERKKAQEEIKNSESQLRILFENVEGYASLVDTNKRLVIFNQNFIAAHRLLANRDPVLGEEVYHFLPPEERKKRFKILDSVLNGNKEIIEADHVREGKRHFFRTSLTPVVVDDKVTGISVYTIDLTKSKEAELAIREAEIKFRSLAEKSLVGVYIIQDEKYAYVNPKFAEIFGYGEGELINSYPATIVVDQSEKEKVAGYIQARLKGKTDSIHYEAIGKKKDGTLNNIEVYGSITQYNGKPAIIGSLIDITKRRETEQELRKSEERYRYLFNNNPACIFILDINDLKILEVNDTTVQQYGYGREEFMQRNILDTNDSEEGSRIKMFAQKIKTDPGFNASGIWEDKNKAGETMYMNVALHRIVYNEKDVILVVANNVTEKVLLEKKLEEERLQKHQEITEAVITAQENERQQIGWELHDNVNQLLASSRLYLGLVKNEMGKNSFFIDEADKLIDSVIDEIRDLSHSLIPPSLNDFELIEALNNIINLTTKSSSLNIINDYKDFNTDNIPGKLKLSIYRIVQEQFNNIIKHAEAKNIVLKLRREGDTIILSIKDDGKGFDTAKKTAGVGLINIRTRASLFNGVMNIISSPGNGCELMVRFN